jgi:hypothetical protein
LPTPYRNWTSARLRAGDPDPDRVLLVVSKLEVRNRQAVESRISFVGFLTLLLQDEVERWAQHALCLRLCRWAVDPGKTLESFDPAPERG